MDDIKVENLSTLYVDLDGTLICSDLLCEAMLLAFRQDPMVAFLLPIWLHRGRAALKTKLALRAAPAPQFLPYQEEVIAFLMREKEKGRKLVLVTASHRIWAEAISRHLGLFDAVIATENGLNMKGHAKLDAILEHNGGADFGYIGDGWVDMPVWKEAAEVYAVGPSEGIKRRLRDMGKEAVTFFEVQHSQARPALRALRPHQWSKNLLIFLPLLCGHVFDAGSWLAAALAFVAFSAASSASYVINDMLDIEADRTHPEKSKRPFASGELPIKLCPVVIGLLLVTTVLAASPLPPMLWGGLGGYLFLAAAYSIWLKRRVLVDVFMLAAMYSLRVLAGGWATEVPVSNWLMGMSVFLFLSLAFAKRGIELRSASPGADGILRGRDYGCGDVQMINQMGIASAYAGVLLLAIYINGEKVQQMYARPDLLWLICAVLLYWLSRIWVKVNRGLLHHDPVIDALKDPISILCGLLVMAIAAFAA